MLGFSAIIMPSISGEIFIGFGRDFTHSGLIDGKIVRSMISDILPQALDFSLEL